jgi:hypothetical protein
MARTNKVALVDLHGEMHTLNGPGAAHVIRLPMMIE